MKKIFLLTALACCATHNAYAAGQCSSTTGQLFDIGTRCYGDEGLISISTCNTDNCTIKMCSRGCVCTTTCGAIDGGNWTCPSECSSQETWSASSTGYQAICGTEMNIHKCVYACAEGYYGNTDSGGLGTTSESGCSKCPPNATCPGGSPSYFYCNKGYYRIGSLAQCMKCPNNGTTAGIGATSVTECYLPAGTAFSDDTGSGVYSSDCYYSN